MYHHNSQFRRLAFETMENRIVLDAAACAELTTDGADAPVECQVEVTSDLVPSQTVPSRLEAPVANELSPELEVTLATEPPTTELQGKTVVTIQREGNIDPSESVELSWQLVVAPPSDLAFQHVRIVEVTAGTPGGDADPTGSFVVVDITVDHSAGRSQILIYTFVVDDSD